MPSATADTSGRPMSRLDTLLTKLLDLTLRNRLLNFRPTKQSMQIAATGEDALGAIEDLIAKDGSAWLRLAASAHVAEDEKETPATVTDLGRGILRMRCSADKVAKDAIEIFRRAQRTLDETGANPLFLVIGTLEHCDPETKQAGRAPLILVPLEIERLSRSEGCRIRRAEADVTLNAALLEFLRQRHRLDLGLTDLPEDESGIDVHAIFAAVRARIGAIPGWVVHEETHIACLDFRKWPIWTDIRDRREQVTSHPIIRTVLERRGTPAALESNSLEAQDPVQLALPLPCDGSQLAAVLAAGERRTFVLQGPPGTGKSQTIANLISHAVCGGLRVLFVAEKQVALDVVARRLADAGLTPWMLNLHPERCGRSEFVAQVKEALDRLETAPSSANIPPVSGERTKLAALRDATATVRHIGLNSYTAAEHITAMEMEGLPQTRLDLSKTVNALLTQAQFNNMLLAAQSLAYAAKEVMRHHAINAHPLHDLQHSQQIVALVMAARVIRTAKEAGVPVTTLAAAAEADASWSAQREALSEAIKKVERVERAHTAFKADGRFESGALTVDPAPLLTDLRTRGARFWPLGWFARRAVARALAGYSARPVETRREWLESALSLIAEVRASESDAREAKAALALACAAPAITSAFANTVLKSLAEVSTACAALKVSSTSLKSVVPDPQRALATSAEIFESLAVQSAGDQVTKFAAQARRWSAASPHIEAWFAWQAAAKHSVEMGLTPLVSGISTGAVQTQDAVRTTEYASLRAWHQSLHGAMEQFRSFDPILVDRMAAIYAKAFDAARAGIPRRAAAIVKSQYLAFDKARTGIAADQMSRLAELRALQRPRRSIRTLIRQTGGALAAIKPIVLSSPLSAAMHLDPQLPAFDLVVFDEASQIPLADALGALSRGSAAVVVGDSKQLPPTSFFESTGSDLDPELPRTAAGEDTDEDQSFEELESLLDEFVASRFPELMLRWHYRSRDERLIAFSNAHIYGGKLQTFPAVFRQHPQLGISLRLIDGVYDRSKTRTNPAEAAAVVAELAKRLRDPAGVPANRSLGVVAFSVAQQTLIQDLFDELIDGDESIRATLSSLEESVLIKNLEAVQGDERATMLFSIGYGRDAEKKLALNFGPMNRAGGERRLNVAITRSREQMVVFSTIRAGDIDLSKSGASGIRLLRDFLEFAEHGITTVPQADKLDPAALHAGTPDAIEESVARALESRGWTVDRHVGRSNYRISLALRDRNNPDRWCLGIEIDGPFWQSGATVADREILRCGVLHGLGWKTKRIWSKEWIHQPEKVLADIELAASQPYPIRA